MSKTLTTQQFIKKAISIHGNEYDYSKVNYIGCNKKITIICKTHGDFYQKPGNHLNGRGCSLCAGIVKYKLDDVKSYCLKNEIIFLENNYRGARFNYNFGCSKDSNHVWNTTYHNIKNSQTRCPYCYGNGQDTIDFVKSFCLKNNIIFLDEKYYNNQYKHNFMCLKDNGHTWKTKFDHIKNSNSRCPKCSKRISIMETEWLNSFNISQEYRQKYINIDDKAYFPDAFNPIINTIYEFFGDYHHGNINNSKYPSNETHPKYKKTYGQLYQETMDRVKLFEDNGYKVVYIWENDWKEKYLDPLSLL